MNLSDTSFIHIGKMPATAIWMLFTSTLNLGLFLVVSLWYMNYGVLTLSPEMCESCD